MNYYSKPKHFFSGDFVISGLNGKSMIAFDWGGNSGSISTDGLKFEVEKDGWIAKSWFLKTGGQKQLKAEKTLMKSEFSISGSNRDLRLFKTSFFGDEWQLEDPGFVYATYSRQSAFTRTSEIKVFAPDFPSKEICFGFWLVTWMRKLSAQGD
ncbi:MAG: hypothetical protein R2684_05335 [Pyrinomonadaceae bacterium]